MSLFISTENQQLLYGMIHKTPEINVFSIVEDKNQWFRSIIERFSTQLPPTITRDKLKEVNREVLAFMMNSLRSLSNQKNTTTPPPVPPQRMLKREQPIEPREYTTFYDLPKPKIIDFSEKIEDPVITNMEELIEQQKRMRERELQEYAPPPLVPNTPIPGAQENVRMKILEELPKGVLQPIEKHVQFEDPFMTRLMESLDRLNTRMEQIEKKMDQIIPPKIADSVSIIKDIISREVEEPTVPPTTPSLGSANNSL
jgi:uncharacterized protein YicC (UPF0701 family)